MFEAKWNDSDEQKAAADEMMEAVSCLLTITYGKGKVFVYSFTDDIKNEKLVKVFEIKD